MREDHTIIGIHITDRVQHAAAVQHILTDWGDCIKTRLGLHETAASSSGSPNGVILLEFAGTWSQCDELTGKLRAISGVEVKTIVFSHR